jgi:hypothetical protein
MMPKSDDTANTVLDHEPYAYASLQLDPPRSCCSLWRTTRSPISVLAALADCGTPTSGPTAFTGSIGASKVNPSSRRRSPSSPAATGVRGAGSERLRPCLRRRVLSSLLRCRENATRSGFSEEDRIPSLLSSNWRLCGVLPHLRWSRRRWVIVRTAAQRRRWADSASASTEHQ